MTPVDRLRASFPDLLVALDFDGPIAPIVSNPDDSRPVERAAATLHSLADHGVQVAIVTGRDVETLLRLSGLSDVPGLRVMGIHGAQKWTDGALTQIESPQAMQKLREGLPEVARRVDEKLWIEDKELSLVVHVRSADNPERAAAELRSAVVGSQDYPDIEAHDGKMILEFRVPGIDKGGAMETLLEELNPRAALFAGDDYGDLPAFAALHSWAQRTGRGSLRVAIGELAEIRSSADHHCDDASTLMRLLGSLVS